MNKNKEHKTVLLVSNDDAFSREISCSLDRKDFTLVQAKNHPETLALFEKHYPSIVFLDIEKLPLLEMDIVNYIKTRSPLTEIIILTTINELENATYSLRHGASFYLMKPVLCSDLQLIIEKLLMKIRAQQEHNEFEHQILFDLMAGNPEMEKILKLSLKIAPTTSTVLIGGESGTGKEFFAKIIHRLSQRMERRFIPVNCGAIPDALFESELFGHKKGSFTGAIRDKPGFVEEAHMGTLFLDEIGELSPSAQVKLLRFLQERSYHRVGDETLRTVNVRIIAASNKNLAAMVKDGTFREDLFYRLNVFYIHLPPLRKRKETIPNLLWLFIHQHNTKLKKRVNKISKAAEVILAEYDYPGNVRELENIIEHAMVLADQGEITEADLPEFMFGNRLLLTAPEENTEQISPLPLDSNVKTLAELEEEHIRNTLDLYNYSYLEAAKKLGISRSTLWRKIKIYNIEKKV